jgi:hypothetical protein
MRSKTIHLTCGAVLLSALVCGTAFAQGKAPVPTKLFGIELGTILEANPSREIPAAQIPAKAFRGLDRGWGHGGHYYFEPISVNPALPYQEDKVKPSDDFYKTSYRLYLLPIAPKGAKTIEEFDKLMTKWEILTINWEEADIKRKGYPKDGKEEQAARANDYFWAVNLCKTFMAELAVKPEILDFPGSDTYTCRFTQDERTLEVSSSYNKSLRLEPRRDISDAKHKVLDTAVRQLQARDLLK